MPRISPPFLWCHSPPSSARGAGASVLWTPARRTEDSGSGHRQIFEERLYEDDTGTFDQLLLVAQNIWGLRYIDDLIARRVQRGSNSGGWVAPDGSWGHAHLSVTLSDTMFSVRRIIGNDWGSPSLSKWSQQRASLEIDYAAYGQPDPIVGLATDPWTDFDADGDVDAADYTAFNSHYKANDPEADRDTDGDWDFFDVQLFLADSSAAGASLTPTGREDEEENPFGLAGYRHDRITGLYHIRNRVLEPEQGKWLQRDPAGFVDGGNLYQYVISTPTVSTDTYGLKSSDWRAATITDKIAVVRPITLANEQYTRNLNVSAKVDADFRFKKNDSTAVGNRWFSLGMTINIQWRPTQPCKCPTYHWEQRVRVNDGSTWFGDGIGGAGYTPFDSFWKYNPGPSVAFPGIAALFDSPASGSWVKLWSNLSELEQDFETVLYCVAGPNAGTIMAKVVWGREAFRTATVFPPNGPGGGAAVIYSYSVDYYITATAW